MLVDEAQSETSYQELIAAHSGVCEGRRLRALHARGAVRMDGAARSLRATAAPGEQIQINNATYKVIAGGGRGRLQLQVSDDAATGAAGEIEHPVMNIIASRLGDEEIASLADYFETFSE